VKFPCPAAKLPTCEFQKIVDRPGVSVNSITGSLAKLGLARAYALEGEPAKIRVAYQDFFALWKDADQPHPTRCQIRILQTAIISRAWTTCLNISDLLVLTLPLRTRRS
jgi:hypothetical protein